MGLGGFAFFWGGIGMQMWMGDGSSSDDDDAGMEMITCIHHSI